MALPEMVRCEAELLLFAFCQTRVNDSVKAQYHLAFRIRGNAATVYVCLGPSRFAKAGRKPVAQFRYDPEQQVWVLYCADRSLRWHRYDNAQATAELADLIMEIHVDPEGVFFE